MQKSHGLRSFPRYKIQFSSPVKYRRSTIESLSPCARVNDLINNKILCKYLPSLWWNSMGSKRAVAFCCILIKFCALKSASLASELSFQCKQRDRSSKNIIILISVLPLILTNIKDSVKNKYAVFIMFVRRNGNIF